MRGAKKLFAAMATLALCLCMTPLAAFAGDGLVVGALDEGAGQSDASLEAVSSADNPVQATVIDPTDETGSYDLYYQWSDDTETGLGKYHWDKVTLAVYVDTNGVSYYFVTNPQADNDELICTCVYIPDASAGCALNFPGYVQLVKGEGAEAEPVGDVRKLVKIASSSGDNYGWLKAGNSWTDEPNVNTLYYWYGQNNGRDYDVFYMEGDEKKRDTNKSLNLAVGFTAGSVYIPKTVKSIGSNVFLDWSNLDTVEFEQGSELLSLGYRAFGGTAITDIALPETLESLGAPDYYRIPLASNRAPTLEDYERGNAGTYATSSRGEIAVESFDDRVRNTGSDGSGGNGSVFLSCKNLKSVSIPSSVREIGNYTFNGCSSLVSVTGLGACEVDYFGQQMFDGDTSLKDVELPKGIQSVPTSTFKDCSSLVSLEIPASVSEIGSGAFNGASSLVSFEIPASVTSISDTAFSNTSSLAEFVVAEGNAVYESRSGIIYTKDPVEFAFIPDAIEGVLEIPEGVTALGKKLQGKAKITEVVLPNSLASIGNNEFQNCSSLTSIKLPEQVASIGSFAFDGCRLLESVEITHSGDFTFGDTATNGVVFQNTALKRIVFSGNPGTISITASPMMLNSAMSSIWEATFKGIFGGLTFLGQGSAARSFDLVITGDASTMKIDDAVATCVNYPTNEGYFNAAVRSVVVQDLSNVSEDLQTWCNNRPLHSHYASESQSLYSSADLKAASSVAAMADVLSATAIEGLKYTSEPQDAVTVSADGLAEGADYEIAYSDNVNAGTGKATIKGLGAYYACEPLEVEFTIEPADIADAVTVEAIDVQTATGEALEPAVTTAAKEGAPAVTADDYDVSYANNTLPGTATVTLTGKGNFTGTATGTFTIVASGADQAAASKTSSEVSGAIAGIDAEKLKSGDEEAVKAFEDALGKYNELSDIQKTQVDGATTMALIDAQAAYAAGQVTVANNKLDEANKQIASLAATAKAAAPLAKPTLTAKTKSAKKGKVTVAWNKVDGATGYEVKVGSKTYTVKGAAKVSKTVKAKKGKKVKVQVRAFRAQGDNTMYSPWSKAKKVKVKK